MSNPHEAACRQAIDDVFADHGQGNPRSLGRPLTLSVEDAAELLGVGRTLAYQEAKAGRLPGVFRVGRLYRVSLPVLYRHLGLPWPPVSSDHAGDDEPDAA